jgi:hypothetical protein
MDTDGNDFEMKLNQVITIVEEHDGIRKEINTDTGDVEKLSPGTNNVSVL